MSKHDYEDQYLAMLGDTLYHGQERTGRNGVIKTQFAGRMEFDLRMGFPLLTTKKVHFKSVLIELLWFLKGATNVKFLHEHGVTIWDEWADENGELGPVYGRQWRSWNTDHKWPHNIDQIADVIKSLREDPFGRRHIVSAWNVGEIEEMALPPCHMMFQFYVRKSMSVVPGTPMILDCQMYQRSADLFLGVPFNMASYALLTQMVAQVCGYSVGNLTMVFGDYHIYEEHFEAVKKQLKRSPVEDVPYVAILDTIKEIDDFLPEHFELQSYDPWPAIQAQVKA